MSEISMQEQQAIEVTPTAKTRILQIMEKGGFTPDSARIRISVVSGGCSGLTYKLDIEPKKLQPVDSGDQIFLVQNLEMAVDMRSYLYLAGTRLEFSEGLQGKGFTFENPNASRTCSCGESFSL